MFQSIVEADLRSSVNDGLDELVRVVTAGTAAGVTGDIRQKVRRTMTVVQGSGYTPDILAIDPAGAQNFDLLHSSGSEEFCLWGPGQGAPGGPFGLQMRVWKGGTGGPVPRSSIAPPSAGCTPARSSCGASRPTAA